jgi:hypothetical protein
MKRSLTLARRTLLGLACTASLGFGTAQAFATVQQQAPPEYICVPNDPYWSNIRCNNECVIGGHDGGQCNAQYTRCECYDNPPIWPEDP